MTTYWLMLVLPSALAFASSRSVRGRFSPLWCGVGLVYIITIGFRYQVGGDWDPYWTNFREVIDAPLTDSVIYYRDPGYWFFNWLFANMGLGIWALNGLCALLSVSGVMAIAKRQPRPWVALAVAVPYVLIVVAMGYVRQSAAFGVICWALLAVQDKQPWRFLFLALTAATFHKSAVLALPLFVLSIEKIRFRHWVLLGLVITAAIAVLVLETIEAQWYSYVEKEKESGGAMIRVAMNCVPALLLLIFRKRLGLGGSTGRVWVWFSLLSIGSVFVVTSASTAVDRVALYLLPLQIVIFGRLHRLFGMPALRAATSAIVLLTYFIVQFTWLHFANHADNWVPYQFYPLIGEIN